MCNGFRAANAHPSLCTMNHVKDVKELKSTNDHVINREVGRILEFPRQSRLGQGHLRGTAMLNKSRINLFRCLLVI